MKTLTLGILVILVFSALLFSCKSSKHSEDAVRLIHLYKKEYLQGQPVIEKSKPAEWRFKDISSNSEPTGGWQPFFRHFEFEN